MPRSWQYPRWRRYLMQAVMWLIFAGTIALAAYVDHRKHAAQHVELAGPSVHSGMSMALPKSWKIEQGTEDNPLVVLVASEPGDSDDAQVDEFGIPMSGPRKLTILRERTGSLISPVEYLAHNGVRFEGSAQTLEQSPFRGWVQQTVAGQTGVLVAEWRVVRPMRTTAVEAAGEHKSIYACTVLPSDEALTIKLEGRGLPDRGDIELVRRVAESIAFVADTTTPPIDGAGQISGAATTSPSNQITFANGMRVALPAGFRLVSAPDPNATNRQLLRDAKLEDWAALDLVPVVMMPEDGVNALLTLLAAHDPQWRGATVKEGTGETDGVVHSVPNGWGGSVQMATTTRVTTSPTGATTASSVGAMRRFRVDSNLDEDQFPSRAYVIAEPSGHALVAIFHGGGDADVDFESIWKTLADSVQLPPTSDFGAMLDAGAVEAKRLAAAGLDSLLEGDREDEMWLWYRETPEHYVGWSSLHFDDDNGWKATRELRFRVPQRAVVRIVQSWRAANDLRQYHATVDRTESAGAGTTPGNDARFNSVLGQTADLRAGKIGLTTVVQGVSLPGRTGLAPAQYVPGAALTLLIGKLAPTPMILKSESFVGDEGIAGPGLLTLIVRPSTDRPRTAGGESEPMRCVTVEVNGSGEISRWYFQSDGTLESVDFSDHLHRVRGDPQQLKMSFGGDPRMAP